MDAGPEYAGPVGMDEKVLLIEPNEALRRELRELFERSGYSVIAVKGSAAEALSQVMRWCPDLIVMGERAANNGCRELMGYLWCQCPVPVMMLGESSDTAHAIPYLEMGVDAYVSQSVDSRELLARARNLLRLAWNGYEEVY